MHQHGSKYFVSRHLPLTLGVKRSEQCHVAYQIKGNHEFGSMVANIVPAVHPPLDPGVGVKRSKFDFFQNMVMLHVKLKGITKCSNIVANMIQLTTHFECLISSTNVTICLFFFLSSCS